MPGRAAMSRVKAVRSGVRAEVSSGKPGLAATTLARIIPTARVLLPFPVSAPKHHIPPRRVLRSTTPPWLTT